MGRTVSVKLMADVANFTRNIGGNAVNATKSLSGELDRASKAGKLDHVADSALKFGAVGAAAFGLVVKSAADFDKQMSAVSAATHASAGELGQLRAASLQAGKDTQFSATEAAKGVTELSKAGVSTADILGGGLKGALSLAAAGQIEVGDAAETAASAMTQFKLKGDQIPHVADLLAAGAGKAQGSVQDMSMALNQSGLIASQTGLSIEDTTGTLAAFASAGLTGSDAGTSFKTMLQALQAPSGKTRELMEDLGISAYDAQGNFIGVTKLAGQLKSQLSTLTPELRANAMAQIFGSDATRAASVLYEQGQSGIQGWIDKTNDAGYAADTAARLTDNLAGDVERLKGSLETMAIEAGSGANGGLRLLVKATGALVDEFGQLPPVVGSGLTVLAGIGGVSALALAGFIKLRKGLADAVEQLNAMGPAGEKAASKLEKAASIAGKAALVFAALEIVGAVADHFGAAAVNTDKLTGSLTNLVETGKTAGELKDVFGDDMKDLSTTLGVAEAATHGFAGKVNDLISGIPGIGSAMDSFNEHVEGMSFNQATAETAALNDSLVTYMTTTNDARKASDLWNRILKQSGLDTEQLAALLPDAYKKVGELNMAAMKGASANGQLNSAMEDGTAARKEYTTSTDASAAALRGERDALVDLSKTMKSEVDPVFGLMTAEQKLAEAQTKTAAAIKKHGRNSTEAKEATRELALAAIELQGKVGQLGGDFDGKMTPALEATLRAAHLTDKQIADLSKQFVQAKTDAEKYDGDYAARTTAPGGKEADAQLKSAYKSALDFDGTYQAFMKTPGGKAAEVQAKKAWDNLKGVDGDWVANMKTTGYSKVAGDLRHLLAAQQALKDNTSVNEANRELGHFFNAGGPVNGLGGPTSDTIKAWLSPGEHVWTAAEVAALGGQQAMLALRGAVRSGKRVEVGDDAPGFASGGAVMMPFPANVKGTKIPVMALPGPSGGGQTYKFIESVVHAQFPGLRVISDVRPGARTLSGNLSYHGFGRAVDWPASHDLAVWWNQHYKAQTKEFISPWNNLNIHNGQRHSYTGAIYRQHSGSNAHDHIAMAGGGQINEPVFGYGASGRSYSFGERGPETVIPGVRQGQGGGGAVVQNTYQITMNVPPTVNKREIGREIVDAIQAYQGGSGKNWNP